ncbi:helix-turn-helix domain-containing protein [Pararhodobacter oceanensis]|uniref:arsenate reductase/protein-tyrosine-phosphatase family protein n=1 Tax=Pararhodobacter oceanensis TaxID=2172121 RepID=UPI003A9104EA
MDALIPHRLSTLGHPQRLAVFRLLMRRYPDRVPATELAQALGLKPNTLSTYVSALMQAGLISQQRHGTSLRYAIDMDAARDTIGYLLHDCCRGRPEICAPEATPAPAQTGGKYNVLFVCTGNSARSILAEAMLRDIAGDRFATYSAGTTPRATLHPAARALLEQSGHDISGLRSKHIAEFQQPDAPEFDFVFTVCNQAANEDCPTWSGQPVTAHWGLADPAAAAGSDTQMTRAFAQTYATLHQRLSALAALPIAELAPLPLQQALDTIGQSHHEGPKQ